LQGCIVTPASTPGLGLEHVDSLQIPIGRSVPRTVQGCPGVMQMSGGNTSARAEPVDTHSTKTIMLWAKRARIDAVSGDGRLLTSRTT
jgi:hypothetical protein